MLIDFFFFSHYTKMKFSIVFANSNVGHNCKLKDDGVSISVFSTHP